MRVFSEWNWATSSEVARGEPYLAHRQECRIAIRPEGIVVPSDRVELGAPAVQLSLEYLYTGNDVCLAVAVRHGIHITRERIRIVNMPWNELKMFAKLFLIDVFPQHILQDLGTVRTNLVSKLRRAQAHKTFNVHVVEK